MTAGFLTKRYCYGDCLCFDRVGVIVTANILTKTVMVTVSVLQWCYGDCWCLDK